MVFRIEYYAVYSHKVNNDYCNFISFRELAAKNLNDAKRLAKSKYFASFQFDKTKLESVVEERSELVSFCR